MFKKAALFLIGTLLLTGAGCININSAAPTTLGVYRSPDKGETWKEVNALPTSAGVKSISGVKVYRIFTDPSDRNALYLGSRGQGLFYTYDKGDTWQFVPYFQGRYIYGVSVDPHNKCSIYVTDGSGIYRTDDCSRTWKIVYSSQAGARLISVIIDYQNSNVIFAGADDGTLIQSTNGGGSWRVVKNFGGTLRELVQDPQVPGRMYAASASNGISRSDDGGVTWKDITGSLQNFSEGLTFYRFVLDPSTRNSIYWLSKYGVFHSTDAGETWVELKLVTSPGSVNIFNLAVNPKNAKEISYTATVLGSNNQVSSSKLYRSVDGGVTWFNRKLPSSAVPVALLINLDDPSIMFTAYTSVQ
jgi:photosystem II stability/assembly factor-like uncharacterized protein